MTLKTPTEQGALPPRPEPISPELVLVDPALAPELGSRPSDRDEFPPQPTRDPRRARPPLRVREDTVRKVAPGPIRTQKASTATAVRSDSRARRGRMSARIVRSTGFAVAGVALLILAFSLIFSRGPSSLPERSGAPGAPRTFAWPEEKGADAYEFRLYRATALVFRARTTKPRLVLPVEWKLADKLQRLMPGAYRWYVWPVARGRDEPPSRAIVQARLVIPD
jgi:hypothetical protein